MDEMNQTVETQPAPASVTDTFTESAPQADAAGPVVTEDNDTVALGDLMADKPAEPVPAGDGEPAAKEASEPNPEEPKAYKTQAEVDAAMGRVRKSERDKLMKQYGPALRLAQMVQDANPGTSVDDLLDTYAQNRAERLGISPELEKLLRDRGVLGTDGGEQAYSNEVDRSDEAAERIGAQADEIQKIDPSFDLAKFLEDNHAMLPEISRGDVSIKSIYLEQNVSALIERARNEGFEAGRSAAVQTIRSRNSQVPTPPTQSAPAGTHIDFNSMSAKEFAQYEEKIEQGIRDGRRVMI